MASAVSIAFNNDNCSHNLSHKIKVLGSTCSVITACAKTVHIAVACQNKVTPQNSENIQENSYIATYNNYMVGLS